MADNAGGVFLNTINGTPDIQVNEGIPNEKRVRDIALAVAESTQTVSVQTVLAEVDDVIYNTRNKHDHINSGPSKAWAKLINEGFVRHINNYVFESNELIRSIVVGKYV